MEGLCNIREETLNRGRMPFFITSAFSLAGMWLEWLELQQLYWNMRLWAWESHTAEPKTEGACVPNAWITGLP